ncbi:tRNA (N6-isopentenyl adenosine(37)-C2)-methylthiotransferase MiaB [Peptococcus simiae]|uniref:tRNA (N6-isopentenyl adenosine(37)-C2)-methylthiotransferase MiaB n=1 Tax=Peptococcus simiae TaxID=1643805 RepID=UPI00397FBEB3
MSKGSFYFQTYGCQMNEHDSEIMAGLLAGQGYTPTDQRDEADIIIINTCCIREKAEHKVLSLLGELRGQIEADPNKVVAVCGCMVQQEDIVPKIRKACPHVKLIIGTHNFHRIAEYIDRIRESNETICDIPTDELLIEEALPTMREFPFKAFVNITYGCNNYCTYCIVPYVRGRERSRDMVDILNEVRSLVADGVKEVTFLGQNVNSYGNDLDDPEAHFPGLLRAADQIEGLERIRFMTSHPKDLSQELIDVIADSRHICHYIHLPVQAGSSRILQRMNRRYTKDHYLTLVEAIRKAMPEAALTTDIIVGFPGETEEDFQETLDLVERVGFDNAFAFAYSPRAGTPAEKMTDQIPLEEKKDRLARLNDLLAKWSLKKNQAYLGKTVKVLVDGVSKSNDCVLSGKTDTGKIVLFAGNEEAIGTLADIQVESAQTWVLKGKAVK